MASRILQALSVGEIGGTELMVLELVTRLDRSEFQCEVSVLDRPGPVSREMRARGVPVHELEGWAGPAGAFIRLLRLFRRQRYDIVHLYGFRVSLLGRLAARFVFPRPMVIHGIRGVHVTEDDLASWRTRVAVGVERQGRRLVDLYVTNSQGAVEFLASRGLPRAKFLVIPNGIDGDEWVPSGARPAPDEPEVICVANFRPIKRQADLIDALALLRDRGIRARARFVGDGPTRAQVEALTRARGLEGQVAFTGLRSPGEVRTLLQHADVFVLPSLWEGMPGAVMQAMATGLPVVATDVAGTNELVGEGVTGYLVPPKDPAALADRLQRLLADPGLRVRMGEAGRTRIRAEFSVEQMVLRHERAYRRLTPAARTGAPGLVDVVERPRGSSEG
jgi:glycosyltransferase involved in cell wall biosynthesis